MAKSVVGRVDRGLGVVAIAYLASPEAAAIADSVLLQSIATAAAGSEVILVFAGSNASANEVITKVASTTAA